MTEKMIENRVKKLNDLQGQIADLQKQADAIKAEIQQDMEAKGADEVQTAHFFIRWKEIVSNRLDSKALKSQMPEIYNQFCRVSTSRRFTIA